jgi:1,4-dihydroxy-2-naphthoyl-CoA synthase
MKVVYEKRDRIGYVTLNRPEALNALDQELNDGLWDTWADIQMDDSVDVAIVTGAGKAFCSAKETILDVIGRPLDDALRMEAVNGYSSAGDFRGVSERLQKFFGN